MENVVVIYVADLAHAFADDFGDRKNRFERTILRQIRNRYFAANNNRMAFCVGFAGDATVSILSEASVEDGIRNGVANFIGMTFPD